VSIAAEARVLPSAPSTRSVLPVHTKRGRRSLLPNGAGSAPRAALEIACKRFRSSLGVSSCEGGVVMISALLVWNGGE
jgi:hypothetical protein